MSDYDEFMQAMNDDPDLVNRTLREAGIDPDELGKRFAAFAKECIDRSPLNPKSQPSQPTRNERLAALEQHYAPRANIWLWVHPDSDAEEICSDLQYLFAEIRRLEGIIADPDEDGKKVT